MILLGRADLKVGPYDSFFIVGADLQIGPH